MIPHSRPFLPPHEAYSRYTEGIWQRQWLTNQGPLVKEFEEKIARYLGVEFVSYLSSGTTGLQCMLRTLARGGEVITTPFSYVATAGAVFWEGFTPVFADVETDTLAINHEKAAALIGENTRAILATHVYGLPANVAALETLAAQHGIPIFFDGAHAFGVKYHDRSLLSYGDCAVLSLHATKVFHTANGGLVVSRTAEGKKYIDAYRNFGHDGPNNFPYPGINGKNSEFHAALGLAMLPYADALLERRRGQWQRYRSLLKVLPDKCFLNPGVNTLHNGAYFPILNAEPTRASAIIAALAAAGVEARRYFYPALNTITYMAGAPCPVAEALSESAFCLPLHHDLTANEQEYIAKFVLNLW